MVFIAEVDNKSNLGQKCPGRTKTLPLVTLAKNDQDQAKISSLVSWAKNDQYQPKLSPLVSLAKNDQEKTKLSPLVSLGSSQVWLQRPCHFWQRPFSQHWRLGHCQGLCRLWRKKRQTRPWETGCI